MCSSDLEIIKDRQARAARAKGSNVLILLDPKLILDFIDLWHKDANTPLPEMKVTPGQSHVLTAFIEEEKWKFEEGRRVKKAQYKKQRYLKDNVLTLSLHDALPICPLLSISNDFIKFLIISFVFIRRYLEGDLLLVRTWSCASSSSGLCFQEGWAR